MPNLLTMKLSLTFLFGFLISCGALAEVGIPSGWVLKGQIGDTKVFTKKGMTLTVLEGAVQEMGGGPSKNETEKSLVSRGKAVEFLGKGNWTASVKENFQMGRFSVMQIEGAYSKESQKYRFYELQAFSSDKFISLELEWAHPQDFSKAEINEIKKILENQ